MLAEAAHYGLCTPLRPCLTVGFREITIGAIDPPVSALHAVSLKQESIILKKTKPVLLAIGCLLLVGWIVVYLRQVPPSAQLVEAPELSVTDQPLSQAAPAELVEIMEPQASQTEALLAEEPSAPENVPDPTTLLEQDALVQLLPAWMHEEGVDFYFEKAEVMGAEITRCRGRYHWDDGAHMEYELTDVGADPNPELIQGLGFNFDQENTESESGYASAYELEAGVLLNHEYDEAAGEGSLQVLVDDRFLLEVQLEGFEAEAFEDVLENHLPLDELLRLL